jgi:Na+/H+-dicarboxylate symporter
MKDLPLHWKIIIGLVLGTAWAIGASFWGGTAFTLNYIAPFGTIFINLLKLIAIPLVLFSIIMGIVSLNDTTTLGRMGLKTLILYLITTTFAISLGLLLVNTIKPGERIDQEQRIANRISYELWVQSEPRVEALDDQNFLQNPKYASYIDKGNSQLEKVKTNEKAKSKLEAAKKSGEQGPLQFLVDMVPSNIFLSFNDSLMLQVIFFALFFGITMITLPKEKVQGMIDFCDSGNEIFLKMVDIVMRGAPFFVFALMAGKMAEIAGDNPSALSEVFQALGWYSLTVIIGLGLMVFLIYPLLVRFIHPKMNYRRFFKAISPAQFLAFSTSSSAATLPVTMEVVNDNLHIPKRISSFVLPIGATVNMDGTSLYQAVAVVFLAQFHLLDLNLAQQATIVLTATLASIGSAAVPSAGLIMLIIVLESVGLNPAWIALIFPVDRILDMCRTVVNVTGDVAVTAAIAASEKALPNE